MAGDTEAVAEEAAAVEDLAAGISREKEAAEDIILVAAATMAEGPGTIGDHSR